jgi:hypothetical protein
MTADGVSVVAFRKILAARFCSLCLKLYYNSYILSVIDYYCTVWGNASCTHIDKLYKLQKRAARIFLNATTETPSAVMCL